VADISAAGITFPSTTIVKISANGRTSPRDQPGKNNTFSLELAFFQKRGKNNSTSLSGSAPHPLTTRRR
jgi:hypothetical protein